MDDIVFGGFTELIVNKDENVKILVHPCGSSPGADDVRTPGSPRGRADPGVRGRSGDCQALTS